MEADRRQAHMVPAVGPGGVTDRCRGVRAGRAAPSVRELAAEAGVNPNTMQRAMADLESRGLAVANRTAGRCVTNDMETIKALRTGLVKEQVARFLEKMRDPGYTKGDEIRACAWRMR